MKNKWVSIILCIVLLTGAAAGCANAAQEPQQGLEAELGTLISTAEDLQRFLSGTTDTATLTDDISMGEEMLRLENGRGNITIHGGGHIIAGTNACVLRMDNGTKATLNDVHIVGTLGGIGILGGAEIAGTNLSITASSNGIEATGIVTISAGSSIAVESKAGSALVCVGAKIMDSASFSATGLQAGVNTARGDLQICKNAVVTVKGADYNALKTDGSLILEAECLLSATNTDTHNGAKVGSLIADETATIQASGGDFGIGLFIVEQTEDVVLRGYCNPDVRYEMGQGRVSFKNN